MGLTLLFPFFFSLPKKQLLEMYQVLTQLPIHGRTCQALWVVYLVLNLSSALIIPGTRKVNSSSSSNNNNSSSNHRSLAWEVTIGRLLVMRNVDTTQVSHILVSGNLTVSFYLFISKYLRQFWWAVINEGPASLVKHLQKSPMKVLFLKKKIRKI